MAASRDYPKLLTPELQEAIRDHDLPEAVRLFTGLRSEHPASLELWAELLDELAQHGYTWSDWADDWPGGESGLERPEYFLVLGIQALQEEVFEKASYFLHRCAESVPQSPVPLAYLGIMFESQGCPTEALIYYQRCLGMSPRLFSVLNAVGNLYHELGFYEESIAHYRRALPLLEEPINQAILLGNLGNSLRALGHLDEAIAVYTEAIALDPAQASSSIALAETLFEAKRAHNAIGCLTDSMMMAPFDEWSAEVKQCCYGLLARAYWQERRYPECIMFMWMRNGNRLNEEDREGITSLLKALFCWGIEAPGNPANEYLLAKVNRHLGYFDAALHHAKRAVKAHPNKVEHFIELGATLLLQGKLPVALEAFEEAHTLAPERAEIHTFRAMSLWETDPETAKDALYEAIRLEPNQALHYCDLAFVHQAEGEDFLAQEAFQKALLLWERAPVLYGAHGPVSQRGCYTDVIEPFLAENANSPEAATHLLTAANFLILSRRKEPARKALHRLLSEQPTHLDALRNYAWLLTREGWMSEALSVWEKVLSIAPEDDVSRYFWLNCLSSAGTEGKQTAIRELEKALKLRPDYFLARLLLARLLEPSDEALYHLETLCAQLPKMYSVWYAKGQSHFHRQDYESARTCLDKALALNPNYAQARQLAVHCHRMMGDEVRAHLEQGHFYFLSGKLHLARINYDEALLLSPGHEEVERAMKRLERRLDRLETPSEEDLYQVVSPRYRYG